MPWPKKQTFDDGDKVFLKKDEIVKVQILEDEPELYYTHYVEGKTSKCSAPDCAFCFKGEKRNEKGSIKVKDMADGKEKRLSGTAALFLTLQETFQMCGGREGFIFSMKATGDKAQRRYHVVPLPVTGQPTVSAAEHDATEPFL